MHGYEVDLIKFITSRYTDKNIMMRAQKGQQKNNEELLIEYRRLREVFGVVPPLERYLYEEGI